MKSPREIINLKDYYKGWIPRVGTKYWYISIGDIVYQAHVLRSDNLQNGDDFRITSGNCFKTKKQAEKVLHKIRKILKNPDKGQ